MKFIALKQHIQSSNPRVNAMAEICIFFHDNIHNYSEFVNECTGTKNDHTYNNDAQERERKWNRNWIW